MKLISRFQLVLITIFTIVEVVGFTVWFYIYHPDFLQLTDVGTNAFIVLLVFLQVEHIIATISGNNPPREDTNGNPGNHPKRS